MSSLLNPYNNNNVCKIYNSLQELQFNDLVGIIYPDVAKRNKILTIFSNALTDPLTIYYRQDIIKDIIQNRLMFDVLVKEAYNLKKTYADYNLARGENSKGRFRTSIAFGDQRNNLYDYSKVIISVINTYKKLNDALSKSVLSSLGLKELRSKVFEKVQEEDFTELEDVLKNLQDAAFAYSFNISIDDTLSPSNAKYIIANGKQKEKKSFFTRKKETKVGFIEKDQQSMEDFTRIHLDAYNEIIALFEDIFESLYHNIAYLSDEILFFEFTMKLHDMLDTMRVSLTFPIVSNKLELKHAIDPFLSLKYIKEEYSFNVYGNDLSINEKQNIIVVGANNTGKTVFARTIGLMQIMAQNGLFVCAREASFVIKETIVSIISGEEDDTDVGGRFEKEVIEIKNIIENVTDNSFVIVNEIFQSTFASDGRRALIDILNYFTELGVSWFAVTHLLTKEKTKEEFLGDVLLLHTTSKENKYRIEKVNEDN